MIKNEKLEQLLIKNWANIIDLPSLIQFVKNTVKNQKFPESSQKLNTQKTHLSISKFSLQETGFEVCIDFVLSEKKHAFVGTIDCILTKDSIKCNTIYGTQINRN